MPTDPNDEAIAELEKHFGAQFEDVKDKPKPATKPRTSRSRKVTLPDDLQGRIAGIYDGIGTAVGMFAQPGTARYQDAEDIQAASTILAESWMDVCRANKFWAQFWIRATEGGAYGKLIITHGALALPIAMRHGLIPEDFFASLLRPRVKAEENGSPLGDDNADAGHGNGVATPDVG